MKRSRNRQVPPSVRTEFCENCGESTESKRIPVAMPTLALRRLRCHCCNVKLLPKVSKRDGQVRVLMVASPEIPGLVEPTCKECAGYCHNCRYDWEE